MATRKIEYYKNYYHDFIASVPDHVRRRIENSLHTLCRQEWVSTNLIKHIRDGLYELRVSSCGNEYRVFFIFEANRIIVLFHGFQKKKQKTPKQEIDKALSLKKEYYEQRGK
jgi:putative addiction module killer protein